MSSVLVEESDEYDSDSLNCDNDVQLDFDEIPESPKVDYGKPTIDDTPELNGQVDLNNAQSRDSISSIDFKRDECSINDLQLEARKIFTSSSLLDSTLPKVFVVKTNGEKILDYRPIVKTKIHSTKHSFAEMKFKDFKEAKKNLLRGINTNLGCSVDINHRSKNIKNQIDSNLYKDGILIKSKKGQSDISKKMNKMMETIQSLSHHISKLETKKSDLKEDRFIKSRKSVYYNDKDVIIDNTIYMKSESDCDDTEINSLDLTNHEIPDSLENSENELEPEDHSYIQTDKQCNAINNGFINKRQTISSKFTEIIVDQSMEEEDCDKKEFDPDSLECKSIVSETSLLSESDKNEIELASVAAVASSSKDSFVNKSEELDTEEIELKLYKRKRTNTDSNNKVANTFIPDAEYNCDKEQNIPQYPVRSKKDRKYLIGFMCKACQEYFATRDVSKEQLKKLVQACSRHRGNNVPQQLTKNSFWQTDFPPSPESSNQRKLVVEESQFRPKTAKCSQNILDEDYSEWEANIDFNSRESNVLYSTKLN